MLGLESSLEERVSIADIIRECEKAGLKVNPLSLKWRVNHGKIKAIRDLNDYKKRIFIPSEEVPNIISYYREADKLKRGEYRLLSQLSRDVGISEKSLYPASKKLGIETFKIGNRRVITKEEYEKWKPILEKRYRQEEYPRGYVPVREVIKECKKDGLIVNPPSLCWRICHGKVPSITYENKGRKINLVPIEEIPNVFAYYSQIMRYKDELYHPLSELAEKIGLKSRSLHGKADKLGIKTITIGQNRVLDKREYEKWRIILGAKKRREREEKENYVTASFISKKWEVSRYLIVYRIKHRDIPAQRTNCKYLVSRKEFEEHGDEWREKFHYDRAENNKV